MGYIFVLDVKKSVAASIDVFGDIKIFSCDKNRMLSIKKVQKYIKKLVKDNELGCDIALVSQDDLLDLAKENVIYD